MPELSAAPPDSQPPSQQAKESHDPGPVFKYSWDMLRQTTAATLTKEVWAVDRPSLFRSSFRRLKKKSTVLPAKQVGRAVKQLADTGKITGSFERAKELFSLARFGHGEGPGLRPLASARMPCRNFFL